MSRIDDLKKATYLFRESSSGEIERCFREHLASHNWFIIEETRVDNTTTIGARNPNTSIVALVKTRQPQIVHLVLSETFEGALVEIRFEFSREFETALRRLYLFTISVSVVGLFAMNAAPATGNLLFGAGWAPALAIYFYIADGEEYQKFLTAFRSRVEAFSSERPLTLSEPHILPTTEHLLFRYRTVVLVIIFILFAASGESVRVFAIPLEIIGLAIVIPVLILMALYLRSPTYYDNRWRGYLPGLGIGFYAAMFAVIPIMLANMLAGTHNPSASAKLFLGSFGFFVFALWGWLAFRQIFSAMERLKQWAQNAQMDASIRQPDAFDLSAMPIAMLWLVCALLNLLCIYFAISGLEHLLLGTNYLFPSAAIATLSLLYGPIGVAAYSFPIIGVVLLAASKRRRELYRLRDTQAPPSEIIEIVREICLAEIIDMPRVVIDGNALATSSVSHSLGLDPILRVSQGMVQLLSSEQLRAVLAHEVFHLKRHSRLFAVLDILSEWTLFGKGFLVILLDTRQLEFEADRFSVKYLETHGSSKQALIAALGRVHARNSLPRQLAAPRGSAIFSSPRLAISGNEGDDNIQPMSLIERARWLYDVYFGDLIISYLHPTIPERIRKIEAMV